VLGEAQDLRRVEHAARAEAGDAAEDRGPREALLAQPLHQGEGQRPVLPLIALADEHADQGAFAVQGSHPVVLLQVPASILPARRPSAPAARQAMTVTARFREPSSQSFCCRYWSVS